MLATEIREPAVRNFEIFLVLIRPGPKFRNFWWSWSDRFSCMLAPSLGDRCYVDDFSNVKNGHDW